MSLLIKLTTWLRLKRKLKQIREVFIFSKTRSICHWKSYFFNLPRFIKEGPKIGGSKVEREKGGENQYNISF